MVNYIVDTGSKRETWFFYGVKDGTEHAMKDHLQKIDEEHDHIHICPVYSRPRDGEDIEGVDYKYKGRVGADLFNEVLPSNNYDFYFCGPPPMMNSLFEGLREWGVPENNIHYEAFGPATVTKKKRPTRLLKRLQLQRVTRYQKLKLHSQKAAKHWHGHPTLVLC